MATLSAQDLEKIWDDVNNWGRWGPDDELGALNHLTPERRAAAAATVVDGHIVSCAHDLALAPNAENPVPAAHHMLASGDARDANGIPGYEASRDWLGCEVHGLGVTHLDALCHMFVRGEMYNGVPASEVRSTGARRNTVLALASGIVGRGVLLDIPAARGVDFLTPDDPVTVADLEAAQAAQKVSVGAGDLLMVSCGRDTRRSDAGGQLSPFAAGIAGMAPECLPWLHERDVAMLCGDGISDPMPGPGVELWPFPIHQIGITGMGLHLIDNCQLGRLADACAKRERWAFLLSVAPLRIPGGTGCPVNPVAVL